jgi:RNA-binding protein
MHALTTKQRAYLKSLAHPLKPILQLGREGVSDGTARAVESALDTRELLKIKVLDASPLDARESAELLAGKIAGLRVVQVIGKTVVLYRAHPERPAIELPR